MKNLYIALFALFTTLGVSAQDTTFGLKAGVNFAKIGGDDINSGDVEGLTAYHFGLVAEFGVSESFSVQPELLYSVKGYSFEDFGNSDTDVKLNYISIPVMAKYYIADGVSLEAGPQIGVLVNAKSGDEDIRDFINGLDYGVALGFGYKFDGGFNVSTRYTLGLSNINDENIFNSKNQNNVFQLSVGYLF